MIIRNFLVMFSCLVLNLILVPNISFSAQDAKTTLDDTKIFSSPNDSSKVLSTLKAGQNLRISSFAKEGWYKVRVPESAISSQSEMTFGWIRQENIVIASDNSNVRSANLEFASDTTHERRNQKDSIFSLKLLGSAMPMFQAGVFKRFEKKQTMMVALGGAAELLVRLNEATKLAFRIGSYAASTTLEYAGNQYKVETGGAPLLVGLERKVNASQIFDFSVALYVGTGIANGTRVTATNQISPNYLELKNSSLSAYINTEIKYWLSRKFALFGELGLYYSRNSDEAIPEAFNGDQPFRDNAGALVKLNSSHFGPVIALGLEYQF